MANYAAAATAIFVTDAPGVPPSVTVDVQYRFRCGVPVADLLICNSRVALTGRHPDADMYAQGAVASLPPGEYRLINATATLPRLTVIHVPGTDHR